MKRTREALSAAPDTGTSVWPNPRHLLLAAAIFHLVVTMSSYGLGRYEVLPGTFDTNGIAVSFASDGIELREEAAKLSEGLARGQIRDWLAAHSPLHLKLYSISFALLGPFFGPTILSAEPVNALCYLAILVLVFQLGQMVFSRRAGLLAAAMVALWPSFLLHTTQLLKDPLFLVGMLAFIFVNIRLLSRTLSWPKALLTAACGGLVALFTWLVRDSMAELLIATVLLGGATLIVQQFREKRYQASAAAGQTGRGARAANLIGMALLIVLSVGVTRVVPQYHSRKLPHGAWEATGPKNSALGSPGGGKTPELVGSQATSHNPLSRLAAHVGKLRQGFVLEFPDSTSNVDSNVQLNSKADVIRYLPRAAVIGFFAPFPNMWFATGDQVGSAGRMLSGLETIGMYLVEGLAIIGIWSEGRKGRAGRGRRRFSVCFLWLVAAMGLISLGLVVVNVGALYRLRYVFLILLIILATEGAARTLDWCQKKRSHGSGPVADV